MTAGQRDLKDVDRNPERPNPYEKTPTKASITYCRSYSSPDDLLYPLISILPQELIPVSRS